MGFNDYYIAGSYFGYWSGAYATSTISGGSWATATGSRDNNCVNLNPNYNSTSDLTVTNLSLAVGTPIAAVTTDMVGVTRSSTSPTIGATEIPNNNYDASISALGFTNYCAGATSVVVTIANYGRTSLSTANINWKVNGVSQPTYSWSGSLTYGATASVTLGSYSFTSGTYSLSATTSIPDGQTDQNTANDQYSGTIYPGLSGTYTIGSTGTYSTFTAAVAALTADGLCGAVKFNVQDGTYNEQISIAPILNASSTNRIIFTSNSNDSTKVTLTNNSGASNYVVNISNASYITFKKMTIQATNSSNSTVIAYSGLPTSDSIANCRLYGYSSTSTATSNAVVSGIFSTTPVNVTIYNNIIKDGSYGIYWTGTGSSNTDQITVVNNQFTNQYYYGSYFYNDGGLYFNNNIITSNSFNSTYYGLYTYWIMTGGRANQINNNRVYGSMTGYGMYLYYLGVNSSNPSTLTNNMVQMGSTASSTVTYGMYFQNANYQCFVYNNSAAVYGTNTGNYAGYFGGFVSSASVVENNIWANFGNGTASYGAAVYCATPGTSYSFDYNDLYAYSGGNIGNLNGTSYTSLSAWKAAVSTNDANAISANPGFTSTSDLHASSPYLKSGISLSAVTTDFDGQTRASTPDIGADEFTPPTVDGAIVAINNGVVECAGTQTVYATFKNLGANTITSGTISWSVNAVNQTPYTFSGSLASGSSAVISLGTYSFTASTSYTISVTSVGPNGVNPDGFTGDDNLSSTIQTGLVGTYTINPSGSGSTNFTSFSNAASSLSSNGLCGAVIMNASNGTYSEQVSIGAIAGSSAANTVTFNGNSSDSTKVNISFSSSSAATDYIINLAGTNYVKFKKITFSPSSTSYGTAISMSAGASYDSFTSCQFLGSTGSYTASGMALVYMTGLCNYTSYTNSYFSGGAFDFYMQGTSNSTATCQNGVLIKGNTMSNAYYMGIYGQYITGAIVSGNNITTNSAYTNYYGMYVYYWQGSNTITGNKV